MPFLTRTCLPTNESALERGGPMAATGDVADVPVKALAAAAAFAVADRTERPRTTINPLFATRSGTLAQMKKPAICWMAPA